MTTDAEPADRIWRGMIFLDIGITFAEHHARLGSRLPSIACARAGLQRAIARQNGRYPL
jgi:hypothetical protein